ncbi:MAG: polyprenyl synthetase family protein [Spirochaetes bacterium]|nr:polyprenyl synthetase family protein [Spirochaetota bacterium]MBN2769585.1 polyprenyl synthetase family protein [Spirochaetota bacterium]
MDKQVVFCDTNVMLHVPSLADDRKSIRDSAASFAREQKIIAPLPAVHLSLLADSFLRAYMFDESYRAYSMLALANEVWRPVVASVPYERRILILPECLKSSTSCQAARDSMGLVCAGCMKCQIGEIYEKAEGCGYQVIVSEGTTVARQIVLQGGADAIIGVGCLDSLSRIFEDVQGSLIPSIGIPLLRDGCMDTAVDMGWLEEELLVQTEAESILHYAYVKRSTEAMFTKTVLGMHAQNSYNSDKTVNIALEYLLLDGKRIRPMLFNLVYESLCDEHNKKAQQKLALSIESFHKASLIHDDIEDDDDTRYGVKNLHRRYGVPAAINIGDYLIGLGYSLISGCGLTEKKIADCLKIASRGHVDLTIGQGHELFSRLTDDIVPLADLITRFKNKTSAAFRIPLLMGAAAAGAPKPLFAILEQFADSLGIAYQIHDDLHDYSVGQSGFLVSDSSFLFALAIEDATEKEKDSVREYLIEKDYDKIIKFIGQGMVVEQAKSLLKEELNKALTLVGTIQNKSIHLTLRQLVIGYFNEYL